MFRAAGFPTVDAPVIAAAVLAEVPADTLDDLRRLDRRNHDVLVLPYGSAFPLEAWWEVRTFLKEGGGLVVLGGAPFHQPVLRTPGGWKLGTRQPTFASDLLIGPAERVEVNPAWNVELPNRSWTKSIGDARNVWALTVRLATRADLAEHGAEGHRDAVLRPLVHLVDAEGVPRACPLLEIDHLRDDAAGARWIFTPSDAPIPGATLNALVSRALQGASEFEARPVYASVETGETPRIRISSVAPRVPPRPHAAHYVVRNDAGLQVYRGTVEVPASLQTTAEIRPENPLPPGLYSVELSLDRPGWEPSETFTGFWVRDPELLSKGPQITVSRDWLRRDGKVFPIVGTTYMASDVHRKFLLEPNPHIWDRDFRQMSRLGINFVRTGIWTGWSRVMLNPGVVDEAALRALDAYVQSAAKHGIVVNFTFFAFLPPSYGGSNPYLDPRSLEGQKQFLTAVAQRYRGVNWIHYDLINEPSYAPPSGLWSNRPIRDDWERKAWREWVREHHGEDVGQLRDRWQDRSWDVFGLPWDHEIWYSQIREDRRSRKVRDFTVFSNEVVTDWARILRDTLRAAGGDVLVTLGQDEGGTGTRPSQQLHAEAVDYTAVHPWWQNDDLLATGISTRVPEKPHLFQETGLMRLEDVSGSPWRTPEHAAAVLERKFAFAFASRAAGVIEWAWNINPYMPIDNESVIGFFRPDGTAKPELAVVPEYAGFFRVAAPWLDDFEPDPVVIIIPHSRLFMDRPAATDGFKRMVRVMAERLGVVPTALSELRLTPERLRNVRLVIVPSVEFLDDSAAEALLAASNQGTKILVTGAVTGNPYGEVTPALEKLGIADAGRPVQFREGWRGVWATFDRGLQESLARSVAPPLLTLSGNVWHEPLPLEHARENEPLAALLREALGAAGVETNPTEVPVTTRLLYAPRSVFAVIINENARDVTRRLRVAGLNVDIRVPAGRTRLVLFNRATGEIITQTE
jgi:hypothetical protein